MQVVGGVLEVRSGTRWDLMQQPDLVPGPEAQASGLWLVWLLSPSMEGTQAWGASTASPRARGGFVALSPQHCCLKSRTVRDWPSPSPKFPVLSPLMCPKCHTACTDRSHSGGSWPVPAHAHPPLTAEPLWPASPRSPGTPASPWPREREGGGVNRVCALGCGVRVGAGILTGMPGSPKGPASPSSPALPCTEGDLHLGPWAGLPPPPPLRKKPPTSSPFSPLDPALPGRPCRTEARG